jgi:hypothetical protein
MLGLSGSISISNGGHVPLEDFLAVVRIELFHQGYLSELFQRRG